MKTSKRWAVAAVAVFAVGLSATAYGQETWDGGGADDNLSTAANWADDTAPANPPVGTDAIWNFAGAVRPTPNAAVAFTGLQSLIFTGTTADFTIGGMSLTFDAPVATTISNLDNQVNTINNDITLGANLATFTANNAAGATLVFGGVVDLNGQAVTLTTVNAADIIRFDGTLNTNGGTVDVAGPGVVQFGAGTTFNFSTPGNPDNNDPFTFNGAATLTATNNATLSGVLTTSGGGVTITKNGAARLTLTGDSSATFAAADTLSVDAGTMRIGDSALGGFIGGNVIVNAGATLEGADPVTGDGTRNIGGTLTANAGATVDAGNSIGTLTVAGLYTLNAGATQVVEIDPTVAAFATAGTPLTHDIVDAGTATIDDGAIFDIQGATTGYVANGDDLEVVVAGAPPVIGGGGSLATLSGNITDDNPFLTWAASVAGNNLVLTATRTPYINDPSTTTFNRTETASGLDALAAATPQLSNDDRETILAAMDALGGTAGFGTALDYLSPERYDVVNRVGRRVTQRTTEVQNDYLYYRQQGLPFPVTPIAEYHRSMYGERDGAVGPMWASLDDTQMMLAMADKNDDWGDPKDWGDPVDYRKDRSSRPARSQPQGDYRGYDPRGERSRAETAPFTLWATGLYIDSEEDNLPDRTGYDAETGGFLVGGDWALGGDVLFGIVFGYTSTDIDYRGLGGEAEDDGFRAGVYLGCSPVERMNVNLAFNYAYHSYESQRPIVIGGLAPRTAEADWDGHEFSAYAGVDYDLAESSDWVVSPLASAQYIFLYQQDFTESGAMAANLLVDDQETQSLELRLGGRFAYAWQASDNMVVVPEGSIAYRIEVLNDQGDEIGARFANAGGDFLNVRGDADEGAFEYGAGAQVLVGTDLSLFARYTGVRYEDGDAMVISGGVTLKF